MTAPPVLLTRPRQQAQLWQQDLADAGIQAEILPLIEIATWAPSEAARPLNLQSFSALMFVSASAAQHFWRMEILAAWQELPESARPRLWAPGPGTALALQQLGMANAQIDQPSSHAKQFESETLWQTVHGQVDSNSRILIVRGTDSTDSHTDLTADNNQGNGRNWLAEQIRSQLGRVEFFVAYQRKMPHWSAAEIALAEQSLANGTIWIFSSSQSIQNLQKLMPAANWSHSRALATHSRIAATAHAMRFGEIRESRPDLRSVTAALLA